MPAASGSGREASTASRNCAPVRARAITKRYYSVAQRGRGAAAERRRWHSCHGWLTARRRKPNRYCPFYLRLLRKSDSGRTAVAYLGGHAVQMRMRMKVLNTMRMHVHLLSYA